MNELSHPWARLGGVIIAACIVFFLDTTSTDALHKLWLPLGLAFSAFLMTQALMAVAFACLVMAGLNIDLAAGYWVPVWGYPSVAAVSLVVCLIIVVRRFRQRIAETHDARWARRRRTDAQSDPQ